MPVTVDKEICIGCGACTGVCPVGAMNLDEDGKAPTGQTPVQAPHPMQISLSTVTGMFSSLLQHIFIIAELHFVHNSFNSKKKDRFFLSFRMFFILPVR